MRISDWSSDVCSTDLHENLRRSFAKRRKAAQGHHNRYRAKTDHPCQRPVQNPSEMGVIANLIDTVASTAAVRVLESLIFDDRSDFTAAFGLAECESHLVDRKSTRLNSSH